MRRTKPPGLKPKYSIGNLVVIKSYPDTDPFSGDPLHIPPIMVVTGVEIESKKKKTHDTITGEQIADRIKYNLLWFDNKKSTFVSKIMYESFLDFFQKEKKTKGKDKKNKFVYEFGSKAQFVTQEYELNKVKLSVSMTTTEFTGKNKDKFNDSEKEINNYTPLVTFACPELVITGIRKNETVNEFNDFGELRKVHSAYFIKVMWFNYQQQKYSEAELPQECLINILKQRSS